MTVIRALPSRLLTGAHTRAVLSCAGVSDHELRGPLWSSDRQGLWHWTPQAPDALNRVRRAAAALPEAAALGGWAAAAALGAAEFDGESESGELLPVPLCLGRHQRCRRVGPGVCWRSDLYDEVVDLGDLRVTSPERTCFDLARRADGLRAAVIEIETLLRYVRVDLQVVAQMLADRRRWLGRPQAANALRLAAAGAASKRETAFRLLWLLDAGLPEPEVNVEVTDLDGQLLGRVDLLAREAGLAGEYDGEYHSSAARRAADEVRVEGLVRAGLRVVRVTSPDLGPNRRRTAHRLQQAHREGLRRDRSKDRWMAQPSPIERSPLGRTAG